MYLKYIQTGELIEIIDLQDVIDPSALMVRARRYLDDRMQRAEFFVKTELVFPSDEPLPLCWIKGIERARNVA